MVFSSIVFLLFFLPAALALNFVLPPRARNAALLFSSLVFYFWGEGFTVLLLLFSAFSVYFCGLLLHQNRTTNPARARLILFFAVCVNLSFLGYYKYANFFVLDVLHAGNTGWEHVALPVGISFFTFQAISYIIDVYRGDIRPARSFTTLACYIASFPQLVAGPIVRYRDIETDLHDRKTSVKDFSQGANRFFLGLGKKVLIANPLAQCADTLFALPSGQIGPGEAWLGTLAYSLQIYYDFSGYSDMAIGLGRMLGFHFPENFNYPYIANSIQDFWRRWHISLSTWFRDYLYIPLGGNRVSPLRTYANLATVFLLCGFWHGAAWTFVAWGAYHGLFLVLERLFLGKMLHRLPGLVRHAYALLVVLGGWVIFRAETLPQALEFLRAGAMLGGIATNPHQIERVLTNDVLLALGMGLFFSWPVYPRLKNALAASNAAGWLRPAHQGMLLGVYMICLFRLSASTYNPFLYFRF